MIKKVENKEMRRTKECEGVVKIEKKRCTLNERAGTYIALQ